MSGRNALPDENSGVAAKSIFEGILHAYVASIGSPNGPYDITKITTAAATTSSRNNLRMNALFWQYFCLPEAGSSLRSRRFVLD